MVNEAFCMLFNYHLFAFALGYIADEDTKFKMGWSFMISIASLVAINMIFVLYKSAKKALRAR
jgi:hypothetical protein